MEVCLMNVKKKKSSIRNQLILVMACIVAIPVIVLTAISMINTVKQGREAANEINAAQASIVTQNIRSIYADNIEEMNNFAATPLTIKYLEGKNTGETAEANLFQQMTKIDNHLADGNCTSISGPDGMQLICTAGEPVSIADRDFYTAIMAGASYYISDLAVSASSGRPVITLAVPVYDTDHTQLLGLIQRDYDATALRELLAAEVTQKRQEIVIVDRTGTVVAHSARDVNTEDPEKQDQNRFYTDSREGATEGHYTAPFQSDDWLISWEKIEDSEWIVASCRVQQIALATAYKTVLTQAALGILFMIISIFAAVHFSNGLTIVLKNVNVSLGALANGCFQTIHGYNGRNDELGEIVQNNNTVIEKLESIVCDIAKAAGSVNSSADELADMSVHIALNAENVSTAVQEIASGATQQADEIQTATENMERIETAVGSVTRSTRELEGIVERMQIASNESADSLIQLQQSSNAMNNVINSISKKISTTSNAVGRINEMVETITRIATQTNLLALNASIEAARAGESGKGFAVVAMEIGKLATDSSNSANKIRTEMDELLNESQEAVRMAEDVQRTNQEQQAVIVHTADSVNTMIRDIESTAQSVKEIADTAQDCVTTKNFVVDTMMSLSAISEENAAGSEQTDTSMHELSSMVTTLAQGADNLKSVSETLSEDLTFFKM